MYQTSIRNKKKHSQFQQNKEEYIIDINNETYAYVIKMLGNCRVSLISDIGEKSIGVIRGSLRKFNKRILIEKGDIVVISKRDFQNNKVDIVHKFNSEQSNLLIKENKLSNILSNLYTHKSSIEDDKNILENKNNDAEYFNFDSNSDNSNDEYDDGINNINTEFKIYNLNNKFKLSNNNSDESDENDEECVLDIINITSNISITNKKDSLSDDDIDFI